MAACQGWPQVVRLLCQGGADADRRHHSGLDVQVDGPLIMRSCALHFAAARAHAEVVRVLLEQGADCNRLDDGARRPADLCTTGGTIPRAACATCYTSPARLGSPCFLRGRTARLPCPAGTARLRWARRTKQGAPEFQGQGGQ